VRMVYGNYGNYHNSGHYLSSFYLKTRDFGDRIQSVYPVTLKMEKGGCSETLVPIYQTSRRHTPNYSIQQRLIFSAVNILSYYGNNSQRSKLIRILFQCSNISDLLNAGRQTVLSKSSMYQIFTSILV
jgi:hypothetical protein